MGNVWVSIRVCEKETARKKRVDIGRCVCRRYIRDVLGSVCWVECVESEGGKVVDVFCVGWGVETWPCEGRVGGGDPAGSD